jgi:hypothetical protein
MLTGTKKFVLNQLTFAILFKYISFCRLANMEILKQELEKNRKLHYMEGAGDEGVSNRASFRVQLSETIKDGLRASVGADSSDSTALRRASLDSTALRRASIWNAMRPSVSGVETDVLLEDATALRRASIWKRHSVSGVETDVLLPLIRRCVFVAEVTAVCALSLCFTHLIAGCSTLAM